VVRPNVDTLYSAMAIDLSRVNVVVTIPPVNGDRYYVFPFYDMLVIFISIEMSYIIANNHSTALVLETTLQTLAKSVVPHQGSICLDAPKTRI
jgi:hypothetical protein